MRAMTAQSTACTHLTMRAGLLRMGALVLGASAVALGVTPFVPPAWRMGPIGLVLALSAFPAFMLFLFRAWDPDCGPVASYAGGCTHPVWILAPALVAGAASCVLIWREARAAR